VLADHALPNGSFANGAHGSKAAAIRCTPNQAAAGSYGVRELAPALHCDSS
jgi:hypothetical protein